MLKTKKSKAFTLIEILIAIAIIGIIASIVVIQLNSSREKSRQARLLKYADSVRAQLSSNEVAWWKLDESSASCSPSANCVKDAWNGNNGTPYNIAAAQFGQSGVGKGTALSFNGTSSYILTGINSSTGYFYADELNPNIKWTTSAWFKYPGSATTQQIIMGASGGTGGAATYAVWVTDTGILQARFRGGTIADIATGISDDRWHLIIITWDGSSIKGYFDDKSPIIIQRGTALNQNYNLAIGATAGGTAYYFNGLIDEVQIWNSALTAMEIQQRYAESAPRHGIALK